MLNHLKTYGRLRGSDFDISSLVYQQCMALFALLYFKKLIKNKEYYCPTFSFIIGIISGRYTALQLFLDSLFGLCLSPLLNQNLSLFEAQS